jgi:quercetin dioxygenase-like cupin family protein
MTEEQTETPPAPEADRGEGPAKRSRVTATMVRHAYVAVAGVIAIVALIAAAFSGSSDAGSKQSAVPKGERATQYYKRLVTLGRGLIVMPVAEAVLPPLPNGKSTLSDGTQFKLSLDESARVTFLKVTIVPGASIPWHHHSSPILIDLISGKLVDYRADRPGCAGKTISAGRAQFEPNTQVHTLANPFKVPAVIYTVTWSAKGVDPTLATEKVPPGCPAHPERGR